MINDRIESEVTARQVAGGIILLVCLCLGLGWVIEGNDFFLYKVFAPRREAVRRETFEQSKAYNDGMAQELRSAQIDYVKATPDQKQAIGSIVMHRVSGYDQSKLPADLRAFVRQVESDQGL